MGAEQNTAHGDPMHDYLEHHPFDGQFEPAAEAVAKDNPSIPLPEIAQASIAISLKRLADHLAGDNNGEGEFAFLVSVPGIERGQPRDAFVWGPPVHKPEGLR